MALKQRKPIWFKAVNSRAFVFGEIIFLVLIIFALGKESVRRYEVNKKINNLKKEIVTLESRQAELKNFMSYLESPAFAEKEARLKLGLEKEGESVIIIPENNFLQNVDAEKEGQVAGVTQDAKSLNILNWWNYFFQ